MSTTIFSPVPMAAQSLNRSSKFAQLVETMPISPPESPFGVKFAGSDNQNLRHDSVLSLSIPDAQTVAVLGVGYVGLHLVQEFGRNHNVIAFDVSQKRLDDITGQIAGLSSVKATCNEADLSAANYFLISVPTLLKADRSIDTSYIRSALATVARNARPGATVVIESSVAVGMTREMLGPLMLQKNLKGGMSPERVDPGRVFPKAQEIPKIISGLDDIMPGSAASIYNLYSTTFDTVVPVSKPEVAEMTKLYENCQRMMCIAYANEMANACMPLGIDPFEVCSAAATKPFGYMPFTPSAGVGGHCIPVNPYYLLSNCSFPLLQAATETMASRPATIATQIMSEIQLAKPEIKTRPARVLVVGAGFKPGQAVLSNSPGLAMMRAFQDNCGAEVMFADPLVGQDMVPGVARLNTETDWNVQNLSGFDAVVVAMRQVGLEFEMLDCLANTKVHYCCN